MRAVGLLFAAAALLTPISWVQAQTGIAERLRDRVPPQVVAAVERLAGDATGKGLPVEPLVQKAIEGGAKGIPAPRVVAALEVLAARLEASARAVRAAGVATPGAASIEAGAFALGTGIGEEDVVKLVRASGPPHAPEVTLRVAGALAALGVPAGQTVELVVDVIAAGQPAAAVVSLPGQVQAGIGRGLTPAQAAGAARGVGRGGQGGGPQGPPGRPPRGRPEGKPPRPAGPPHGPPNHPLPSGRP